MAFLLNYSCLLHQTFTCDLVLKARGSQEGYVESMAIFSLLGDCLQDGKGLYAFRIWWMWAYTPGRDVFYHRKALTSTPEQVSVRVKLLQGRARLS